MQSLQSSQDKAEDLMKIIWLKTDQILLEDSYKLD